MKDKKFKFAIFEKVFIIGVSGICIINGRGNIEFASGGNANTYNLGGANGGWRFEYELETIQERSEYMGGQR